MNAAAKRHRLTCTRRREYIRRLGKAASGLPLRQCGQWSQRAHEHTSTRAHDTQPIPIPPQKNLTIRGNTSPATAQKYVTKTPRCASLPRHTATQAPTGGSIIPAAHTEARRTQHAAAQKTPRHEPARPNRRPLHPKNPMSPPFHRGELHFEQPPGRFTTIDPSTGTRPWPIQATTRGVLRP